MTKLTLLPLLCLCCLHMCLERLLACTLDLVHSVIQKISALRYATLTHSHPPPPPPHTHRALGHSLLERVDQYLWSPRPTAIAPQLLTVQNSEMTGRQEVGDHYRYNLLVESLCSEVCLYALCLCVCVCVHLLCCVPYAVSLYSMSSHVRAYSGPSHPPHDDLCDPSL